MAGQKVETVAFKSHEGAVEALLSGGIDGYIADRDILNAMLTDHPDLVESHVISVRGLTYEPYAIAFHKDNHSLRRKVDKALAGLFRDGRAKELVAKHIPSRQNDTHCRALHSFWNRHRQLLHGLSRHSRPQHWKGALW